MILFEDLESSSSHLSTAIGHVQKAIEHDIAQSYGKACVGYLESLPHFVLAFNHEQNTATRALIVEKMREYLARIDRLKRRHPTEAPSLGAVRRTSVPLAFPRRGGNVVVRADGSWAPQPKSVPATRDTLGGLQVEWNDIVGLSSAKETLKEAILLPLKFPHLFKNTRRPVHNGTLLYGPSGCGKRMLIEALVTEVARFSQIKLVELNCQELLVKGRPKEEVTASLQAIFGQEETPRAGDGGPPGKAIIMINNLEVLTQKAPSTSLPDSETLRFVRISLLMYIDQSYGKRDLFIVLSSREPWNIDSVLRKRARKQVYVPLPGPQERMELLKLFGLGSDLKEEDYAKICEMTEGYSDHDIRTISLDARTRSLRRELASLPKETPNTRREKLACCEHPLHMEDYTTSLTSMRPAGHPDPRYEEWTQQVAHNQRCT